MNTTDGAALLLAFLGVIVVALVIGLAIAIFMVWLVYNAHKALPAEHKEIESAQVWFLLIPLFNLYWNFKVFPGMMRGFAAALKAKRQEVEGDGGAEIAKWYCILAVCSIVPYLGALAGLASLVLLIMTLVKAYEHKKRLLGA